MSIFQLAHDPNDAGEVDEENTYTDDEDEEVEDMGPDDVPRLPPSGSCRSMTRPEDDFPFDHPTDQLDYPWNHNDGEL